jgi:hypothetical protein
MTPHTHRIQAPDGSPGVCTCDCTNRPPRTQLTPDPRRSPIALKAPCSSAVDGRPGLGYYTGVHSLVRSAGVLMVTFGPGDLATSILTGDVLHQRQRSRDVVSSGFPSLDALLPAGGVRPGSLIEYLLAEPEYLLAEPEYLLAEPVPRSRTAGSGVAGGGGVTLACAVACRLADGAGASGEGSGTIGGGTTGGGTIVIVDRSGWFHPPAVLPWLRVSSGGVASGGAASRGARLIVARPAHDDDELWAIDQALRCPGVTAVVAWPQAIQGRGTHIGGSTVRTQRASVMRRWQLAARASGAVGLIVRSAAVRGEPCWSEARIAVTPLPSVPVGSVAGKSLPGGPTPVGQSSLLERRLHLERVGGLWCGGDADRLQAVEIVFDLARGCESAARGCESAARGCESAARGCESAARGCESAARMGGRRQAQEVWRVAE